MGRVHAYLLRHRIVETKATRRNVSREEREIATLLRDSDASMRALLEEILDGQGLELKSFNEFEAGGIPIGATVFVLARKPDSTPSFFGTDKLVSKLKQVRGGVDNDSEAKIWFTQLWFILLDLLYTRKNRTPNSLQDWTGTSYTKDVFTEAVKEYINDHVRKVDPATLTTNVVHNALISPKEGAVTQLCNAFTELMVDAGLIEAFGEDTYRQTLLFAYEMKVNFDRQLAPLLPSDDAFIASSTILIDETDNEIEEK